MDDYYATVLRKLLDRNVMTRDMRILVLCGGRLDAQSLAKTGFKHVTISNLDVRMPGDENQYAPFAWSFQDAENITYLDKDFDFCIAHNGLHHCHSPHRALLEAYRVVKKGVLVFEPRDNWTTRLGVRLNFGQEYEVAAVFGNDCVFGGVRNTQIPNYVYRWTEREVQKTVCSYAPAGRHEFLFFHALRVPWDRLRAMRNKLWFVTVVLAYPFLKLATWLVPKQCNSFAFAVIKPRIPEDLHPWILQQNGELKVNQAWLKQRYSN